MFNQSSESQNAGVQGILENASIFHQDFSGRIIDGEHEGQANFSIYQLYNGNVVIRAILGEHHDLDFRGRNMVTIDQIMGRIYSLEGQNGSGWSFRINKASLISISENITKQSIETIRLFAILPPEHLIISHDNIDNNVYHSFVFEIINAVSFRDFQITLNNYSISFRSQVDDNKRNLMRYLRHPMITGCLTIKPVCENFTSIENVQEIAHEVIDMMSLAENNLVSIPSFKIMDFKDNPIEIHILEPRIMASNVGLQLINRNDTNLYIDCVLPEFHYISDEDKNKLKIVIEHLIASKGSELIEDKFLYGMTAIELLSGHISGHNHPELRTTTHSVREKVKCSLTGCLNEMSNDLDPKAYSKLTEIINDIFGHWINLQDKVEKTLEELEVNISDLKTRLFSVSQEFQAELDKKSSQISYGRNLQIMRLNFLLPFRLRRQVICGR